MFHERYRQLYRLQLYRLRYRPLINELRHLAGCRRSARRDRFRQGNSRTPGVKFPCLYAGFPQESRKGPGLNLLDIAGLNGSNSPLPEKLMGHRLTETVPVALTRS